MDLGLRGKTALLVGASRGIGGATAVALAREGCGVAVMARGQAGADERAAECLKAGAPAAVGLSADATKADQLRAAVDAALRHLGQLDILVTLVGGSSPGGFAEVDHA